MRISTTNTFDISADHGWSIIAEQFGDAAVWASSLSSSSLDRENVEVGAIRTGHIGKRQLREKVTSIDRENRVFAYELLDPPSIVQSATNRWAISPIGSDRCEIDSELVLSLPKLFNPLSPLITFGLKRQLSTAIEEFRHFAETGTPHERKLKSTKP